jgi:hypothetical protein
MLATCEQLAAGLGAPGKKGKELVDAVGNAPLRLWVGERFLGERSSVTLAQKLTPFLQSCTNATGGMT